MTPSVLVCTDSHSEAIGFMLSNRAQRVANARGETALQTLARDASVCRPSSWSSASGSVRYRKMFRSNSSHASTEKQAEGIPLGFERDCERCGGLKETDA